MAFLYSNANIGANKAAAWAKIVGEVFSPVDLSLGDEHRFNGTWFGTKLGQLGLNHISTTCERAQRTKRHIAADRSTDFVFVAVKSGTLAMRQFDRDCSIPAGSFALHYTGAPFCYAHDEPASVLCVNVPATYFASWLFDPTRVCAVPQSGGAGLGKVTLDFLRSVADEVERIADEAGSRCAAQLIQLLEILFETRYADRPVGGSAVRTALFRRAKDVVDTHLRDPDLSPTKVAESMQISVRYLHRIFQDAETTVGDMIRERRLNTCRERLEDRRYAHVSLKQIASSAGFRNQAHFAHAFRNQFGTSPSDHRQRAMPMGGN